VRTKAFVLWSGAWLLAATLLGAPPAAAQLRCGDVVAKGAHVVLQGNLSCDDQEAELVVNGPAVVDLNGSRSTASIATATASSRPRA